MKSPRYQKLVDSLKKARREAGLTQEQVARMLGKPQHYVSRCETGERRVDIAELEAFARIYKKPISYFLQ